MTHKNDKQPGEIILPLLAKLRETSPLIYCLSNSVTAGFVANVLYAVGASPVFCVDPLEAEEMAAKAAAVVINLGTLDSQRRQSIDIAVQKSALWVLDPVGIAGLPARRTLALRLLKHNPAIVRANASEILALDNEWQTPSKEALGVDARHLGKQAAPIAKHLAQTSKSIIAMTGEKDFVSGQRLDGSARMIQLSGGHPHMAKITGMGCSVSALCAAFLSVSDKTLSGYFEAAMCALYLANAAGGHGATQQSTKGPASFQVNFIDALSKVGPT